MGNFNLTSAVSAVWDHIVGLIQLVPKLPSVGKFGDPLNWPVASVVLPVVLVAFVAAGYQYWRMRGRYGQRPLVNLTSGNMSLVGESVRLLVRLSVFGILLVALLDPFVPGAPVRVPSGNRDYVVCIADNRGMGAIDEAPSAAPSYAGAAPAVPGKATNASDGDWLFHEKGSRLDFVRNTIRRLQSTALARSNVALIAFQGEANVIVPMTDSPDWIADQLDPSNKFGLHVGTSSLVGRGKVNGKVSTIAACLQAARKVFTEYGNPGHEKFIIYFGNGDDISDQKWLNDEIAKLKDANIHGAIFGVGGADAPIPTYSGDDEQFAGYYKFRDGTEARSGYNEQNLQNLAAATGWPYRHLDPAHLTDKDLLTEDLSDSRIEIGRWHIFDYLVEIVLVIIVWSALAGRRRVKGQIFRSDA
jgi:hypothetical protein